MVKPHRTSHGKRWTIVAGTLMAFAAVTVAGRFWLAHLKSNRISAPGILERGPITRQDLFKISDALFDTFFKKVYGHSPRISGPFCVSGNLRRR